MAVTLPEAWEGTGTVEKNWSLEEYGDVDHRAIYGRNGQMAFHPIERRGEVFSRTLLLNALRAVEMPSLEIARPLREISWAPIPYVCVRDGEGNRYFASIEVPQIINRQRGDRWYAEIRVTTATDTPAIVDTSNAQVGSL